LLPGCVPITLTGLRSMQAQTVDPPEIALHTAELPLVGANQTISRHPHHITALIGGLADGCGSRRCDSAAIFDALVNAVVSCGWQGGPAAKTTSLTPIILVGIVCVGTFFVAFGHSHLRSSFVLLVVTMVFIFSLYVCMHIIMIKHAQVAPAPPRRRPS